MRLLVLGGSGILGTALRAVASGASDLVVEAPSHGALDAADAEAVARAVDAFGPDWIVNCVAYTAVDAAESDVAGAERLNAVMPAQLAALSRREGVPLLHVSTDYVFGGVSDRPWREDDRCAPQSVYGRTKRTGEEAVLASGASALIVRTAWLYGMTGKSFARTMQERARQGLSSRVVDDQWGAPTFAVDLAQWLVVLMRARAVGLYHAANAGACTWADVAERIYASVGGAGTVTRVSSAEYAAPAPRPRYSVLDCARLDAALQHPRRPWTAALDDYLARVGAPEPL